MYLNSTTNQSVWICIVLTIEKQAKKVYLLSKRVKKNENILKTNVNFKILSQVSRTAANKRSLEITYVEAIRLNNALHLTMYEKT